MSGAIDSIFDIKENIQLPSDEVEIIIKNELFKKFASQKVPDEIILSRLPIRKENFCYLKIQYCHGYIMFLH